MKCIMGQLSLFSKLTLYAPKVLLLQQKMDGESPPLCKNETNIFQTTRAAISVPELSFGTRSGEKSCCIYLFMSDLGSLHVVHVHIMATNEQTQAIFCETERRFHIFNALIMGPWQHWSPDLHVHRLLGKCAFFYFSGC